jgi:hypothetical protein
MVELRTITREIWWPVGIPHENWDLSEFWAHIHLPSSICHVAVSIRSAITLKRGLGNGIKEFVTQIPHMCSYHPHGSHQHSHLSLSRPQLYDHWGTQSEVILLHLAISWSCVDSKHAIHWLQHSLTTAYTNYNIHLILYIFPLSLSLRGHSCV